MTVTETGPNRASAAYDSFSITTLTPHLGAEVDGLDLAQPLDDQQLTDLRQAFADWSVLVFRNQILDRDQHKAFGRHFGRLHVHPLNHSRDNDPEILIVKTTKDSPYTAGDGWHTDVTCDAIPPLRVGALHHRDTRGRRATRCTQHVPRVRAAVADDAGVPRGPHRCSRRRHPLRRQLRNDSAGRRLSTQRTPGRRCPSGHGPEGAVREQRVHVPHQGPAQMGEPACCSTLLYTHIATTPRLHCRVRWEPNTLTLWDNRCTQHHAVWDYHPHSRYGERVSVVGDVAAGRGAPGLTLRSPTEGRHGVSACPALGVFD